MGVFCTVAPSKAQGWEIDTLHTAHAVETGRDDAAVSVLLAHIVATGSHDNLVTDDSMAYPQGENTANTDDESKLGHQRFGRTICIHSLAVHPKLQGVGMGKLILKSYLQQIKHADVADRVALICQEVSQKAIATVFFFFQSSAFPHPLPAFPQTRFFLELVLITGIGTVSHQLL